MWSTTLGLMTLPGKWLYEERMSHRSWLIDYYVLSLLFPHVSYTGMSVRYPDKTHTRTFLTRPGVFGSFDDSVLPSVSARLVFGMQATDVKIG